MRKSGALLLFILCSFQFIHAQNTNLREGWQKTLQEKLKTHHIDAHGQEIIKRIAKHTCSCMEKHKADLKDSSKVEDILSTCVASAPKEDMKNALKLDEGRLSILAFGELISYQLLNDGCSIYLDAVLRLMQHEQKTTTSETDKPGDEDLMVELRAMNIDAKGIPYIKSIENAVCDCIAASKDKFDHIKDASDFGEKLGNCMTAEATLEDFQHLSELAGVKLDQSFSEQIGRICGRRMAMGGCPVFLDIITKNIDKLK